MGSQTRKMTVDTVALFAGRVIGLLLGIVRLNYQARYLGVANFGILNAALYFTSLFQPLFDLGLSTLLTREMARKPEEGERLLGRVLAMKTALSVVASTVVVAVGFGSGFDALTNWAVLLTTGVMAATSVSAVYLSAFQAQRKMLLVSVLSMVGDIVLSVGVIALLPLFPGVSVVLLLGIAVALMNLILLALVYRRWGGGVLLDVRLAEWLPLLREGFPIALSSVGGSIYFFISPTVLKYVRGDIEVGLYSAGFKLISILLLIPLVLTQVLYPVFSEFSSAHREKLHKAMLDALRVTALISVPLTTGGILLAPAIFALLYPPAYSTASVVFQIILAGNALGYLAWILVSFLLAMGEQRFCMWNALVVASVAVLASVLLIPRFGYLGAAAITGTVDVVLFFSLAGHARRIGFRLHRRTLFPKILFSAGIMGVVVWLLRGSFLPVPILSGVAVYAASLLAIGGLGEQERQVLRKILQMPRR